MSSLCWSILVLCTKWTLLSRINIQDYSRIKHLDYKTTKEKSAEHIVQVAHYKKAIKDIFKTQNVFSYLIYLHPTEVLILEV